MKPSEKHFFYKFYNEMCEFYGIENKDSHCKIYWDDLSQYTLTELQLAYKQHRTDGKRGGFFPKPADLIRHLPKFEFKASNTRTCDFRRSLSQCPNPVVINLQPVDRTDFYVCIEHYEFIASEEGWRSPVQQEFDHRTNQFTQWAKEAGMTGKQFFDDWSGKQDKKTQVLADKIRKRYETSQI